MKFRKTSLTIGLKMCKYYMKQNNETSWNCFKWVGGGGGKKMVGNLTNVQCKPFQNCHNEFPLYDKYILIFF
jgi:hypothetical protein